MTTILRISSAVMILAMLLSLGACKEFDRGDIKMAEKNMISPEKWKLLTQKRIVFGHQSVGRNILEGLQAISSENDKFKLRIVELDSTANSSEPVLAHFRVGSNGNPDSKIVSFTEHMDKIGKAADIALFKFCYVDIGADTNGTVLFNKYKQAADKLRKQFPKLVIVHVTSPLTTLDGGLKRLAKQMLGKSTGEEANLKRTNYNDLLRKEYGGKEPVFDLAAAESTLPDGTRCEGTKNGARYEFLYPGYTEDGGHLNSNGARHAAMALLQVLAQAADQAGPR